MSSAADPTDWVAKAQQDARSARPLLLDPPEIEDAVFHVHQAIEKAMKALLAADSIRFPRGGAGHDLTRLVKLIPTSHDIHAQAWHLSDLTPWATVFRYPSDDPLTAQPRPSKQEIERKLDEAEAFVAAVARQIGRPSS